MTTGQDGGTPGAAPGSTSNDITATTVIAVQTAAVHGNVHIHAPPTEPDPRGPDNLPAALADFTGRREELGLLADRIASGEGTLAIHAIDGMGGIGKTALALLPGPTDSLVIITSRRRLDGLRTRGLTTHSLDVLPHESAVALFTGVVGGRTREDPAAPTRSCTCAAGCRWPCGWSRHGWVRGRRGGSPTWSPNCATSRPGWRRRGSRTCRCGRRSSCPTGGCPTWRSAWLPPWTWPAAPPRRSPLLAEAAEIFAGVDSAGGLADVRRVTARLKANIGAYDDAETELREALETYRTNRDLFGLGGGLAEPASVLRRVGCAQDALELAREALSGYRDEVGSTSGAVTALAEVARCLHGVGDVEGARAHLSEALPLCAELGEAKEKEILTLLDDLGAGCA